MDGALGTPRRLLAAGLLLLAAAVTASGCSDDDATWTEHRAHFAHLTTTDSLAAGDTLVVDVLWSGGGCDVFSRWSMEAKGDVLTLAPLIASSGGACPAIVFQVHAVERLWPAPRPPFTLRVVGAEDTVETRVVARGPTPADAGAAHTVNLQEQGTGRPVAGFEVYLFELGGAPPGMFQLDSGLTDADGTFRSFVACARPGYKQFVHAKPPGPASSTPYWEADLPAWTCGRSTRTTLLVPGTALLRAPLQSQVWRLSRRRT